MGLFTSKVQDLKEEEQQQQQQKLDENKETVESPVGTDLKQFDENTLPSNMDNEEEERYLKQKQRWCRRHRGHSVSFDSDLSECLSRYQFPNHLTTTHLE